MKLPNEGAVKNLTMVRLTLEIRWALEGGWVWKNWVNSPKMTDLANLSEVGSSALFFFNLERREEPEEV